MALVSTAGTVRRSQAVFTYGTGAIVDFITGSFMPLGLEQMEQQWAYLPQRAKEGIVIYEPRLQKVLDVSFFRCPPVPGDRQTSEFGKKVERHWSVPCTRFPRWLECPKCNRLGVIGKPFELQPDLKVKCQACGLPVNPVRFIVACEDGHIDDFPWKFWVHSKERASAEKKECQGSELYLKSEGRSAALSDLYVECNRCGAKRDLGQIFRPGSLKPLRCQGKRPWLLQKDTCDKDLVTLQRGGSNVHFAISASMISIPPASEALAKVFEPDWSLISSIPEEVLEATLSGYLAKKGFRIDLKAAVSWIKRRKGLEEEGPAEDEASARFQEYEALSQNVEADPAAPTQPEFENILCDVPPALRDWFELFSAAKRLREVRAYCGFTRIQPWPVPVEKIREVIDKKQIATLSVNKCNWFPAIEVRGEGIFLRLSEKKIVNWSGEEAILRRASTIDAIYKEMCSKSGMTPVHNITPRLLLVHSFAHMLIRRLSLDCGYSSASLRERLYVSEGEASVPPMAGILIYTASPDSDGSLGGLVNLVTPEKMRALIKATVRDASWCGNDPVCSETVPELQGDRLSGASCHNCLLLPETACEKFNRELDRVMLSGNRIEGKKETVTGYFSQLLE
jgi:hypothetical protein